MLSPADSSRFDSSVPFLRRKALGALESSHVIEKPYRKDRDRKHKQSCSNTHTQTDEYTNVQRKAAKSCTAFRTTTFLNEANARENGGRGGEACDSRSSEKHADGVVEPRNRSN